MPTTNKTQWDALAALMMAAVVSLAPAQTLSPTVVYPKFMIGVTGINATIENLKVVVQDTVAGSPAAGKFVAGDTLTAVAGNTLAVADPRVVLGEALTAAEAGNGQLVFGVQGKANVTVTIPVLGTYGTAWPAGGCPKSAAIIANLAAFVASKQQSTGGYKFTSSTIRDGLDGCLAGLFLLSTGNPAYLPNVQLHARNLAAAAASNPTTSNWHLGYQGILLAEYYLKTGDSQVLAGLQALCNRAVSQQNAGGWGHDGGLNPGYVQSGLMSSAGVPCLTTFILARECGVTVNDTAYKQALELMYRMVGHGCVPYGDHRPELWWSDTNGRNAMLACAFSLLGNPAATDQPHYKSAAQHLALLVTDSYFQPEFGHTGGGFNVMWRGLGSVHVPPGKDSHRQLQMSKLAWYYDLCRQFGGGFAILPTPPNETRYSSPGLNWGCGAIGLTYTAPLATLRITGAPKTVHSVADTPPPITWGTPADLGFLSTEHATGFGTETDDPRKTYDSLLGANQAGVAVSFCEKYLRHYSPLVRSWAARRLKEINTTSSRTALANAVTHSDPRVRRAVYDALSGYDNWSRPFSANISSSNVSAGFLPAILGTLNNPDAAWWETDGALFALGHCLPADIRANLAKIDQFALHDEWFLREAAFWAVVGLGSSITGPEFKRLSDAYGRSVAVFERNSFDPGFHSVLASAHAAFNCGQRAESVRTLGHSFMNVATRPGYGVRGDHEAAHRTMMVLDDFDPVVYRFMVDDIARYLHTWEPGNQHGDWLISGSSWQVGFLAVLRDHLGAYGKPVVDELKRILSIYNSFPSGTAAQKQAIQDAVDQWEAAYDPRVYAPPPATPRLTAYYDFEGDFNDAPGAGSFADNLINNGVGLASDVPGVGGTKSASFNGNAALHGSAFTTDLGPDRDAYTIVFWVKAADAAQEAAATRLLTTRVRAAGGSAAQPAWQVEGFGNNGSNGNLMNVRFSEGACGPKTWDSPAGIGAVANLGDNPVWHHVAYVIANSSHPDFSGDAYSRTFVDGVEVGIAAATAWTDHPLGNTQGMLIIGGDATDGGSHGFTGLLDDVAVFAGAVSQVDIAAMAAGTRSPADPLSGPPPPNNLAPTLGSPSVTGIFPDAATVLCQLQQASAHVMVVWAFNDQGASDPATWATAPGGGLADLGNFAASLPLSHQISGLGVGTAYAYRFYADNAHGTAWSAAAAFATPGVGNQAPSAANATFAVAENSPAGTPVGQVVANDPDAGQTLDYAITAGDPGGLFAIGSTSGQITVAGALDYEAASRHVLEVTVTDSGIPGRSASATITVDVTDVFEVVTPPVVVTGTGGDLTPSSATLAYAITNTGGENPSVTLRYGRTDAGMVAAAWDTSVALGAKGAGSHTSLISGLQPLTKYFYTFSASNSGGTGWGGVLDFTTDLIGSAGVRLTVYYDFEGTGAARFHDPAGDFADHLAGQYNPAFSSVVPPNAKGSAQAVSFNGNSALFTSSYSGDLGPDPNAWTIMFWIKGTDALQENNNTRLMSSRKLPNGTTTTPDPAWQVEGFGNNGSNGTSMDTRMYTATSGNFFTPDARNGTIGALANTGQTEVWHHVAFVWSNTGHPSTGGAYSLTYFDGVAAGLEDEAPWTSLPGANTAGQLIIGGDAVTAGTRAFTGLLDDVALFAGVVDADDIAAIAAGAISPAAFLASPPVVNDATFAVAENSPVGTGVGQIVANDSDAGQALSYSITAGDPDGHFAIDAGGEITVAGALDYETASQHILTVTVTDNGSPPLDGSAQITVDILNLVESNAEAVGQALTGPGGPFEGQSNPAVVGFAANPDGDPWPNAIEILCGLNPAVADSAMPMTSSFVIDGLATYVEVQVIVDAATDDMTRWHIEFSSDLAAWAESSNLRVVAGQSGGVRTVTIRDDQAVGTAPRRFYRVKMAAGE